MRPERTRGDEAAGREGRRVLAAVGDRVRMIVLDSRGKMMSSEDLSRFLARHRDSDPRPLVFVVGGASGLAPAVRKRADLLLSLSPMTFPHQLLRVMLAEQLYRALAIDAGLRYH